MAANTLIDITGQRTLRSSEIRKREDELQEVRRRHFTARTPGTKKRYRERDAELRAEISEILSDLGLSGETAREIAAWDPYDQNSVAHFFNPEWMFSIMDGFEVVIGNPPYVRQEKIKALKPTLKTLYDCYSGVADLYVYFYEQGVRLLRNNGVLTYISSNKYFRSTYGKKLRGFLTRHCTFSNIIDFGAGRVFAAGVDTSIITMSKAPSNENHLSALNWELGQSVDDFRTVFRAQGFTMPQNALTAGGWRLASPTALNLFDNLRKGGTPLGEYVQGRLYMGIKTGLNEAYVVNNETRNKLIAEHPSSTHVLEPFLRGRDVKRWGVNFAEQYLIKIESSENRAHPWSGQSPVEAEEVFANTYPAIHAHFEPFRDQLIDRYDQGKYFWELRACAYWKMFEQTKIVYPDLYQQQSFTVDTTGFYCGNTCYFLPTAKTWLCGLFNSQAVEWFYSLVSNRLGGAALRAFSDYMKQIPIPNATTAQKTSISNLVNQIIAAKHTDPDVDISALENEIDQIVYTLYNLTPEEIAIVGENTV